MHFDLSPDQRSIQQSAKEVLAKRYTPSARREFTAGGGYDQAAWRELCSLGWAGLSVSEQYGGQALGLVELAVIAEELGYALAPTPWLGNALAGTVLATVGDPSQRSRLLPGIAAGTAPATVVSLTGADPGLVPDSELAAVVIAVCRGEATLVEAARVEQGVETLDATRRYGRLAGPGPERLVGDAGAALDRCEVVLAAELCGLGRRLMEMAVDHAKSRIQFGRPIGAYQAVSHRCAQMLLDVESARSATYYAAWIADHQPDDLPLAASVAKAAAVSGGWRTAAGALQVHGGIGFTWEHDLHLYLKRVTVDGHLLGSARHHRERIAALTGLRTAG